MDAEGGGVAVDHSDDAVVEKEATESMKEVAQKEEKKEEPFASSSSATEEEEEEGQQIKIVIVGDMGVGKSALLMRFADDVFSVYN